MLIIQSGCGVPDMVFLDHLKLGHKTSQRIKVRFGYLHNCFDSEEENFFFFFLFSVGHGIVKLQTESFY